MHANSLVKPFSAMPGPTRLPVVGTMMGMVINFGQWHLLNEKRHQQYGPIWREQIPQFGDVVVTADPRGVKDIVRGEGQDPTRSDTPIWVDYYRTRAIPYGIMHAKGSDWQRMRKTVDKPILRPNNIGREVHKLAKVTEDFVARLETVRTPMLGNVQNLEMELFKWALESSCAILHDRRLGCLEVLPPAMTSKFIRAVQEVVEQMVKLLLIPPFVIKTFMDDEWTRYLQNWDTIFAIAKESVQQKATSNGEFLDSNSFLGSVLISGNMTPEELYSNMSELMMASVDTTAYTSQSLLYELARNPSVQDIIHQEVAECLPKQSDQITYNHLSELTYLKAAIKEAQRLYPIAFNVSRTLQTDQIICGYHVPKGTNSIIALYPLGRNPDYYDTPCEFKPERWIRQEGGLPFDPFAFVPFGLGQRSCVGRRIANIELELMIAQLILRYRLSTDTTSFPMTTKFLLTPAATLNLTLTPR